MPDREEPENPNSDDRATRNKQLSVFALPHKGTARREQYDKRMNKLWKVPAFRAQAKERHQRLVATLRAQQESGAGYPSDGALREFQLDYNNRLMQHGTSYLPTSFSIAEAFFARNKDFAGFCLLPEEDYLISFTDFLDYMTSADAPALELGLAASMVPNRIVNVNSLDTPGSLLLETNDGHGFSILGASYIRRGDEISMLMVVGEQLPEDELAKLEGDSAAPLMAAPHKPDLGLDEELDSGVVFVDAERRLMRDIVLCRFNLKEKRLEARCLLRDVGNRYSVLTDIAETLVSVPDAEQWAQRMSDKLDKASVVWETAKTLLLLPAYLNARVAVQRVEQRTTKLGLQMQNSLKFKRSVAQALPESKVIFRRISAVRVENPANAQQIAGRSYTPPLFQVQVSGFWRMFADVEQNGHDEHGNPVKGKTWVRGHVRHKDKFEAPTGQKVVYIKESLALARRKLEQYRQRLTSNVTVDSVTVPAPQHIGQAVEPQAGAYVYVFRCPAHGRDIYKVGYTDRDPEQRARELSSKTATPTRFLVVQAWAVADGRLAERAAHEALDAYRLDSSREFFQAGYSTLRQVLEAAIQRWLL